MTKLSVLTPSFNYAWCIEDAMNSVVLAGDRVPEGWEVEHVVVDDASHDASSEVLQKWESRATVVQEPENRGQSRTLNRCLSIATGDWVGWLNADDFYFPWSLFDVCRTALGNGVDIIYGDAVQVDQSGLFMRLMAEHHFSPLTLRWWGTYLPVGSVFLRRDLAEKLRWREDLSLLLDWDLWLRAAEAGARFRYLPSPLAAARQHAAQESKQVRPDRLAEKARVRREHRLPAKPWLWRAIQRVAALDHGLRKAITGGYAREKKTAALKGKSMRWFSDVAAQGHITALYEHGYRRKID